MDRVRSQAVCKDDLADVAELQGIHTVCVGRPIKALRTDYAGERSSRIPSSPPAPWRISSV